MLANRVAVVTGGGSGIGRAVVQRLVRERASVVIADQNVKGAQQTKEMVDGQSSADNKHIAVEVDVSRSESVKTLFKAVADSYGQAATLLVNCAGITRDRFLVDMPEEDFDKVIAVNLKGTFLATQLFCQAIKQGQVAQDGSIVNVSSVSAKLGNMGQVNYNASKSGVEALTRTVAREMAKFNVRCNAVMPGFINTPIVETVPQKVMDVLIANIPLRRQGQPEEVADAITFLLSPASSYITGEVLQVSGGLTM